MKKWLGLLSLIILISSCKKDDTVVDKIDESLLGGKTTVQVTGQNAFDFPLNNLDAEGIRKHAMGDQLFSQQFITAPADEFGGLGPIYNQNSCISCHLRDGRGNIPTALGENTGGLLMRLSIPGSGIHGEPLGAPGFGGQLQTRAIYGVEPEGQLDYQEMQEIITFLDGSQTSLTKPTYTVVNSYIPLPAQTMFSARQAPPIIGLGLLEAIPEQDILVHQDIDDRDGDGISGKANYVWDIAKSQTVLGRFGWKANSPNVRQQAADAANHDMGLTSSLFPNEQCQGQSNCNQGLQNVVDLNDENLSLLEFYFQTVAVPAARNTKTPEFQSGKKIFSKIGCGSCHTPSYTTGAHSIPALSNQKIFPYTDLLLHDMGEGLADHRPDYLANGSEWRTSPLWAIGMAQVVNPNARFLHDGRAKTIEEAILWHGGEAENVKLNYTKLSKKERDDLLFFLKSL